MAEELDEFGIPIRKAKTQEVDEFGIPIKKKIQSEPLKSGSQTSSTISSPIGSNPFGLPAVKPKETITLGNGSKSDIGYRKPGLFGAFDENIQGGYASPLQIAESDKLKQIQSIYGGDKKEVEQAQFRKVGSEGQVVQGFADEDKKGNVALHLYNELLLGIGNLAAGAGDVGSGLVGGLTPYGVNVATGLNAMQEYRETIAPKVREYLNETIGAEVDKSLENKYRDKTITAALGGLAQTLPSIAATMASGGVGAASMFLQSYDSALQSLDQSEAGQSLDPLTKTIYATGIGTVSTLLEKAGLDRIMKGNSTIFSKLITDRAIAKATAETGGKITGDVLTKFLNKEVLDLNSKFVKGGAKVLDSYLTEYATGASQEIANIAGENLINYATGKPVFDTSKTNTWQGFMDRVNTAGNLEGIGGGLIGTVAALGGFKKAEFDKKQQSLNDINTAIDNDQVSDVSKEVLIQQKIKLQDEVENDAKVIDEAFNKLDKKQKDSVVGIVEQKAKIEEVKADPNVPDEVKKGLDEQIKELDKQLSEIKPVEEVKVEKPTEYFNEYETAVKEAKTVDEAYTKATSLSENGKLSDTFNRQYNPDGTLTPQETFAKFYNEVKTPTEIITPTEEVKVVEEPTVLMEEAIKDKGVYYLNGEKGNLVVDGQTVTFESGDTIRELGNIDELSKQDISELGLEKEVPMNISVKPDNSVEIEGVTYKNNFSKPDAAINYDDEGNVLSVNLETEDGKKRTFRGQRAEEIAYKYKLNEFEQNATEEQFNRVNEEADRLLTAQTEVKPTATKTKVKAIKPTKTKIDEVKLPQNNTQSNISGSVQPTENENVQVETKDAKTTPLQSPEKAVKPTKEKVADIEVRRQSIKDRISQKLKEQRGNLSSGFDPSLVKDFVELGGTYVEEGIVKAEDFIKRFREDYKDMGFDDSEITDEEITDKIFTKANPQETVEEKPKPEAKEKPKAKKQTEFDELANKRLPTRETRETASNVERETGDELKTSIKEFEGVDFRQSMAYGESVVEAAKVEFGDSYVTDLLEYVEESKMPFENKAVILVSLENNLRKQLLENPKDKRLRKQINVVTKASIEHLRSGATAAAVGIFRQAARVNYETQLAAEAIFSPKEMEARSKVEQAVYSTPEEVQKQYEIREAEIDQAIADGVEKRINEIYESLPTARRQKADKAIAALDKIQKRLRSKTYDASIGVPVAIIDAGISTIKAAIKAGVNIADAVEAGIKKIKEDYGKKWEKEDDFRKDMIDGFSAEGINASTDVTTNLKKELIDAGYGKEITVTTKDGKEKRKVYDWKKLLGVEGSFENLADALEKSMKGKGYSQAEIDAFQAQLQDEYNDIHADIIEKSVNELNRRNTPKDGSAKPLARRLAELYNLGIYEQEPDTYSNILNNILGVTPESQAAFNEIRDFNRSLAKLLETKDANGNPLSDVALASAETQIKDKIKRVIDKAQYADGSGLYKFSVIMKNLFSAMQRMLLVSPGQLIENPFSGKQNDIHVQLQDAFKKGSWDTKELAKYRKMISKAMYKDISLAQGGEYGGVGNPFISKNSIDDFVKGLSKNGLYQAFITASTGKAYLDAADSYFKVKRTENEFTHNLIRILTDKTNPNGAISQEDALKYVSEIITGQSFEDAKQVAENIIKDINKEAGKEVLRATDTNILRIANDVVKDSLVNGGGFTYDQVESAFKAAYKTAGKSMGHEANNFVSMGVQAINQKLQNNVNNALKKKDYEAAAMWNMALTLSRNIISPFVGGGSNWVVIGLQKMGVPTEYFNPSVGWRKKPIDLSSKQGMKELEDALAANATRNRMYGRMLVGTTTAIVAAMAMRAGMDEDEYRKWRRKHPETRKLIDKIQPVPITMMLARKDGTSELIKAMADAVGSRQNFDALKTERATKEFIKAAESGNEKAAKKAWGLVGEMVGRKFTVPYLSNISTYGRSQDKIIKEFMGKKPERKKPSQGFVEGYFRGGLLDYLFGGEEEKPEK